MTPHFFEECHVAGAVHWLQREDALVLDAHALLRESSLNFVNEPKPQERRCEALVSKWKLPLGVLKIFALNSTEYLAMKLVGVLLRLHHLYF